MEASSGGAVFTRREAFIQDKNEEIIDSAENYLPFLMLIRRASTTSSASIVEQHSTRR